MGFDDYECRIKMPIGYGPSLGSDPRETVVTWSELHTGTVTQIKTDTGKTELVIRTLQSTLRINKIFTQSVFLGDGFFQGPE